ncbi:MAG: radical SAM family heme chaperone HemW [Gammaproteobacteria bacterium]|nr:radical SAM family heme chaperone HemW [Gammaproteobacteria bacterium]
MTLPPLSLYVHLPWCVQKCPYCDFNSHAAGDAAPRQRYLEALLVDLANEASRAAGRTIESIFLGGGTPSLFSPDEIGRLLDGVRAGFDVAGDAEITMEANPGTVECGEPAGYRDAGVNRLSYGGQSFHDELLKKIGRIHSSDDIVRAVTDARRSGIDNINIDLMHGLPGQDVTTALEDIRSAIDLNPAHISWYQLTLEPNTIFYARPPDDLPDEDTTWEIQEQGQALLAEHGYRQYEVSAHAKEDRACKHNLNYWLFGDYLAIGAGAHGKITSAQGIARFIKPANPLQYMKTVEARGEIPAPIMVENADLTFEFMLNALRLTEGFAESDFCERTGQTTAQLHAVMRPVVEKGLVGWENESVWRATRLGRRFLNDLQAEFLPDRP